QPGTVLAATGGRGNTAGPPLLSLTGAGASVRDLAVWYPEQGYRLGTVAPYPWTLRATHLAGIIDVTLYNSFLGLDLPHSSGTTVDRLRATCLLHCIRSDDNREYAFFTDVEISPRVWLEAGLPGRPEGPEPEAALRAITATYLTAVSFGRADGPTLYNVRVTDAARDVVLSAATPGDSGFYGITSGVAARTEVEPGSINPHVGSFLELDRVPGAVAGLGYTAAPERLAAQPLRLLDARRPPWAVRGDAFTDDTAALQAVLGAAGRSGGGIVYLPAGGYRIDGALHVPPGVELRGSYAVPHDAEVLDGTTLLAGGGRGASPGAPALVTLGAGAGLRGVKVVYPDQTAGAVAPYPATVRALGPGTWVVDVNIENGWELVDLARVPADGFVVAGLWGTALSTGVVVGAGTQGGWIERSVITHGTWERSLRPNAPRPAAAEPLRRLTLAQTRSFVIGDCRGLQSLGAHSFRAHTHLHAVGPEGRPCTDTLFVMTSADSAGGPGFRLDAGDGLRFAG
ncbi:MAG: glycosyl hydrolase family 28-related protein, partial [Acidimicrobiales bacterium]